MNYREYLEGAETALAPKTEEDRKEVERFVRELPGDRELRGAHVNRVLTKVSEDPLYREKSGIIEWMRFQIVRRLLELHGQKCMRELA